MARVNIAPVQVAGYPPNGSALITGTAADATEKQKTLMGSKTFLIFRNSGATPRVCTITSVADKNGRTGDNTFTLAAGAMRLVGPLPREGWMQTSGGDAGYVYYEAAHAEVIVSAFTE